MPVRSVSWRVLRSRRLAVGLILALVSYSVMATLVAQGSQDSDRVRAWATAHPTLEQVVQPLGLHQAFSTPVFLILVLVLALATTACALERTRRARTLWRRTGPLSAARAARLRATPDHRLAIPSGADAPEALDAAADALARRGFRVRRGLKIVEGFRGSWGAWGSPVFHWALVALFIVVFAGRATRAEGVMGIVIGESQRDAPDGYLELERAPLFGDRFTGVELYAQDFLPDYTLDGISRGPVPTVAVLRGGQVMTSQRVYPNSPLRYGSLLVHMTENGVAPAFSVEGGDGAQVARIPFRLLFGTPESSTTEVAESALVDEIGTGIVDIRIRMPRARNTDGTPARAVPLVPVSIIETAPPGTELYGNPVVLALGESIALPDGQFFRFVSVDDWVLLTVANDWSVPFIYAALVVAALGLAVSILVAHRTVLVGWVEDGGGCALHVTTTHSRRDPAFSGVVGRLLDDAVTPVAGRDSSWPSQEVREGATDGS